MGLLRAKTIDRQALEQLCRYITRPPLAKERVQTNAAGQVVLKLKNPWCAGTTHLVMSPLEFMQLPVKGQLCGDQVHRTCVSSGSQLAGHADDLGACKQPSKCADVGQLILAGDGPGQQRC